MISCIFRKWTYDWTGVCANLRNASTEYENKFNNELECCFIETLSFIYKVSMKKKIVCYMSISPKYSNTHGRYMQKRSTILCTIPVANPREKYTVLVESIEKGWTKMS